MKAMLIKKRNEIKKEEEITRKAGEGDYIEGSRGIKLSEGENEWKAEI